MTAWSSQGAALAGAATPSLGQLCSKFWTLNKTVKQISAGCNCANICQVQVGQMRARAKNNMTKRLSPLGHKVEGKQARVEARHNWRALWLARQVERIRKIDHVSSRFRCCNWFLCWKPNKIQIAFENATWLKKPQGHSARFWDKMYMKLFESMYCRCYFAL